MEEKIYVNRPSLPSLDEFIPYLEKIWESKWLTNNARYHQELENSLEEFLGVKHISLFANGTLALMLALQCQRITGEVITTPFSFVATTHSLHWNGITPVFADIDPLTCNLDPERIEAAITPKTTAILPVHVYGNPCNIDRIKEIADVYGLHVIYDAAHAFGVKRDGESILNAGEMSILSFHATKVFTTMEGGAVISQDEATKKRIDYLKNFGFAGETRVIQPGINAKMHEMQAALGLIQLKNYESNRQKRKNIFDLYRRELAEIPGIRALAEMPEVTHNYAYYPIFVDQKAYGRSRDQLYEDLQKHGVFGRRYFYPLISTFPTYKGLKSADPANLPVAHKIAEQVICLPMYPGLEEITIEKITSVIRKNCND
jgi:dTDP-4-amino-4,6-dideoxygalactose transaminase